MTMRRLLGGVSLLVLPAAVLAADDFAFDIAPGKFDEHCLKIEAGEAIRWRFVASGAVDFNIHHHRGKDVFYPVRRDGVERASGSFGARATDDYCLMWSNKGSSAVNVRGGVERKP
jgi:hypothetical protein